MTSKQSAHTLPTAPRLREAELAALKKKMLANLADPSMAEKVEAAEVKREEEFRKAASESAQAKARELSPCDFVK